MGCRLQFVCDNQFPTLFEGIDRGKPVIHGKDHRTGVASNGCRQSNCAMYPLPISGSYHSLARILFPSKGHPDSLVEPFETTGGPNGSPR